MQVGDDLFEDISDGVQQVKLISRVLHDAKYWPHDMNDPAHNFIMMHTNLKKYTQIFLFEQSSFP